jgi:hypothetical protein
MSEKQKREIRRLRRLLQEMASISEDGEFKEGIASLVKRYNGIVAHLEQSGRLPLGLFHPLTEGESGFDQIGVESRLLAGYLEDLEDEENEDEEEEEETSRRKQKKFDLDMLVGLAPFTPQSELRKLVSAALKDRRNMNPDLVISLAPFLGSEEVGRIVRENLHHWFKSRAEDAEDEETEEEAEEETEAEEADTGREDRLTRMEEKLARKDEKIARLEERLARFSREES